MGFGKGWVRVWVEVSVMIAIRDMVSVVDGFRVEVGVVLWLGLRLKLVLWLGVRLGFGLKSWLGFRLYIQKTNVGMS